MNDGNGGYQIPELLESLGMLALERVDAGRFRSLSECPEWFTRFCSERDGAGHIEPGPAFPFLEAFLFDAEELWASGRRATLKSGPWIEVDAEGREHYIEATAVCLDGSSLLVLERPKIPYEEHLAIVQTGRETSLERDRMVRESQRKEVLLHCIVHDLKGPLSGIVGALAMLKKKQAAPELREYLEIAQRGATRLELLIQGILSAFSAEIESLESFTFDPAEAPSAIAALSEAAISMAPAFRISRVELELDPELDPTGDWTVVGDKVRLDRVLSNLLGNALRYSPSGSTVRLAIGRDAEWVTFSVEDEGPGVPEEQQVRLFQKFSQGKTKAGSSGLGLYFCRITVERWGGRIGYTPREGGGARFWFALRRAAAVQSAT